MSELSTLLGSCKQKWGGCMLGCVDVHVLNEYELLLVPTKFGCGNDEALWKFHLPSREFIEWIAFPDYDPTDRCTSALNDSKTKLYLFGDSGYVIIVDLITKEFTKSSETYHDSPGGKNSKSIFYNGQFHIFGGWHDGLWSHYIWNEEEQQDLTTIHNFKEDAPDLNLSKFTLCLMKSRNLL